MIISYSLCSDILLDPRGVPGQSKFRHCSARVVTDWTCFDFQTAARSVYEIRGLLRYRGRQGVTKFIHDTSSVSLGFQMCQP